MTRSAITVLTTLTIALLAGTALRAKANYIVNGGFETGDFSGWTASGNTAGGIFVRTTGSPGGYDPHSGTFFAAVGPAGPPLGFLSQTFSDTPGQSLEITYYLASNGATPNEFQTLYDGSTLFDQSNIPATGSSSPWPYVKYTFAETATGSDTLEFGFSDPPSVLAFDDVSVEPVSSIPEPVSLLTFGTALAGLGFFRRLRPTQKQTTGPHVASAKLPQSSHSGDAGR